MDFWVKIGLLVLFAMLSVVVFVIWYFWPTLKRLFDLGEEDKPHE